MNKVILVVGAVGLLLAAPAPAKTVTVDISRLGFVPAAVTVQTGDTVTWTNKDTVNHQVVCATCPFTSPPLTPGLSGVLSTGQANQKIEILAQPCGENAAKAIGNVTTTTGGNFTFQTQPTLNTSFQARQKPAGAAVTSSAVSVSVRPIVKLRRNAFHRFTAQVIAAQSFVGKAVVFQRWIAPRHRWTRVKTVFLGSRNATSTPLAGSTVSGVTFGAKVPRGRSVRALVPSGQAGPCYIAAKSPTIRS